MRRSVLSLSLILSLLTGSTRTTRGDEIDDALRDRLKRATVYIETQLSLSARDWAILPEEPTARIGRRPIVEASGSGFLISADGHVITNAHVISASTVMVNPSTGAIAQLAPGDADYVPYDPSNPSKPYTLQFNAGAVKVVVNSGEDNERVYEPSVLRVDEGIDLAVLKIAVDEAIGYFDLEPEQQLRAGTDVWMVGFPGGNLPDIAPFANSANIDQLKELHPRASINAGMVTSVRTHGGDVRYQLDIRANHGNSGGPILNREGRVVGVLYAGIDSMQSIDYAIPISYLSRVLPGGVDTSGKVAGKRGDSQSFDEFMDSANFSFGAKRD